MRSIMLQFIGMSARLREGVWVCAISGLGMWHVETANLMYHRG